MHHSSCYTVKKSLFFLVLSKLAMIRNGISDMSSNYEPAQVVALLSEYRICNTYKGEDTNSWLFNSWGGLSGF